jgi:hypothetical protein
VGEVTEAGVEAGEVRAEEAGGEAESGDLDTSNNYA